MPSRARSNRSPAEAGVAPSGKLDPGRVEAWLFDLDNTLYPSSCDLFGQVDRRIRSFIAALLDIDHEAAHRVQKRYFLEHGTTMRGLMERHGVDPEGFMAYVHDIDLSPLAANPALDAALAALPGRKVIFTNASAAHAARVTERLGIGHHFDGVFDIGAAAYQPKPRPDGYRRLVAELAIDPERMVFIEDSARNLAPAAALGITTVWVAGETSWAGDGRAEDYVDLVIEDLTDWLAELVEGLNGRRASGAGLAKGGR